MTNLPFSYDIATNVADALSHNCTLENFIPSDQKVRDTRTVAVLQAFKRDFNTVKFILSDTSCSALALALSLTGVLYRS